MSQRPKRARAALCGAAFLALAASSAAAAGEVVVVRAGTIHTLAGPALEGGASIVLADGKIAAVGRGLAVPLGARVVDYGADAVIVPGLIAANSNFAAGAPAARTAAPEIRAIDNVDFYSTAGLYAAAGGVTTVYTPPARGRLIAGQGAVVKLVGDDPAARTLSQSAAIHGAISAEARNTFGYWEPPMPATVDVGMGEALAQLPRTTMGAIVGLRELLTYARGGAGAETYGDVAGPVLAELLAANTPWRIDAQTEAEIRALSRFFAAEHLPLVIETASDAVGGFASELAAMGAQVVFEVDFTPESAGLDRPDERAAPRPTFVGPSALAAAGVPFALATSDEVSPRHLMFAAGVASRGGLSLEHALRAITLDAARILGVAERVGSLEPGKDGDLCVLSGEPFAGPTSLVATWIGGEPAFEGGAGEQAERGVVISAEELHLGDGHVLAPGELFLIDGKIAEVGARVSRPRGARVVSGKVAMPGMIDAKGHLGLAGSSRSPGPEFKLGRLVSPGDATDRMVARAGVTTVILAPRGENGAGAPFLAYKPAAQDVERAIADETCAIGLTWSDPNRAKSGERVRALVEKAVEYDKKWREYDAAMASWTPPPPEAEQAEGDEKEKDEKESKEAPEDAEDGDAKKNGAGDEPADEQAKDDKTKDEKAKDDDKKPSKKKKKKGEDEEPETDPVTGVWKATVGQGDAAAPLSLTLLLEEDRVRGHLRCALFSEDLVRLEGTWSEGSFVLAGIGTRGWVDLAGKPAQGECKASARVAGELYAFEAERESAEVPRGQRSERRKPETERTSEPKGKPRAPGVDDKLEPFRRALRGEAAFVIKVDREDEIKECVAFFEKLGVKPVLESAEEAWRIADELAGRVAGVLLSPQVLRRDPRAGFQSEINRYAALDRAGVPIAFRSGAEDGAADLPLMAAFAVSEGLSATGALRALTSGAADIMAIADRVGRLAPGLDGDVLLLDGPPLAPATSVLRVWVAGEEVR